MVDDDMMMNCCELTEISTNEFTKTNEKEEEVFVKSAK
jgi:hypothetical protein